MVPWFVQLAQCRFVVTPHAAVPLCNPASPLRINNARFRARRDYDTSFILISGTLLPRPEVCSRTGSSAATE